MQSLGFRVLGSENCLQSFRAWGLGSYFLVAGVRVAWGSAERRILSCTLPVITTLL